MLELYIYSGEIGSDRNDRSVNIFYMASDRQNIFSQRNPSTEEIPVQLLVPWYLDFELDISICK